MDPEATVRKWMDAFNGHDVDGAASIYAPDAIVYDPAYPAPLEGVEAMQRDHEDFFSAFPDIKVRLLSVMSKGDYVMCEVLFLGTNSGPIQTPGGLVPPTNRGIELRVAFTGRVNPQGLFVEEHRYFDTASLLRTLGLKR